MAHDEDDPSYRNALREARFLLIFWFVCAVWSVGSCYLFGYSDHPATPGDVTSLLPKLSNYDRDGMPPLDPLGIGIPAWAFWGIFAPWVGCMVVSLWFALVWMKDNPEPVSDESKREGHA
ncbi:hypothetical protein K2Y11_01275 [bacterium]|nr:hypothetical protein [bacterium]